MFKKNSLQYKSVFEQNTHGKKITYIAKKWDHYDLSGMAKSRKLSKNIRS